MAGLDTKDTQGLLATSFSHLTCAAYRLLRIRDRDPARAWLLRMVDDITRAEKDGKSWALNLALSREGLRALGLDEDTLRSFPPAFLDGMTSERRTRILGDAGSNDPKNWRWGGPTAPVHVLLLIYGHDETERNRQVDRLTPGSGDGLDLVETVLAGRQTDTKEHFGFMDGVGQPTFDQERRERQKRRTGHATELKLGEFVLGYENEYHSRSLTPTVSAERDPENILPFSLEPGRHDLGLNGSYLVFRHLAQDVPAFWTFVTQAARALWPGDSGGPTRLAAKFVGRWPSGAPLVLHPDRDPFNGVAQ
jgi:deferrochelatase/peroxidase EfeB